MPDSTTSSHEMTPVQVVVRVRPRDAVKEGTSEVCCEAVNGKGTRVSVASGRPVAEGRYFPWDACFGPEVSNGRVFELVGRDVVETARRGYNACVLATGVTGAGKTHTMWGPWEDPGLVPRIAESLLDAYLDGAEGKVELRVSFLEVYLDKVVDLLSEAKKKPVLRVRTHPSEGTFAEGAVWSTVSSMEELRRLCDLGESVRSVASTPRNDTSSRGHCVFSIDISRVRSDGRRERISRLSLVDLAGSERLVSLGKADRARIAEAKKINASLATLGRCVRALANPDEGISPPWRESTLTYLLKDFIGGNSQTWVFGNVSPTLEALDDTLLTLEYCASCSAVVTTVEPNVRGSLSPPPFPRDFVLDSESSEERGHWERDDNDDMVARRLSRFENNKVRDGRLADEFADTAGYWVGAVEGAGSDEVRSQIASLVPMVEEANEMGRHTGVVYTAEMTFGLGGLKAGRNSPRPVVICTPSGTDSRPAALLEPEQFRAHVFRMRQGNVQPPFPEPVHGGEDDLAAAHAAVEESQKECKKLTSQISILKTRLTAEVDKVSVLAEQKGALVNRLAAAEGRLDSAVGGIEARMENGATTIAEAGRTIRALEARVAELEDGQAMEASEELAQSQARCVELERHLAEMDNKLGSLRSLIASQEESVKRTIGEPDVRSELKRLGETMEQQRLALEDLESENSRLESENSRLKQHVSMSDGVLAQYQGLSDRQERDKSDLSETLVRLESEVEEMRQAKLVAQRKVSEEKREKERAMRDAGKATDKLAIIEKERDDLVAELEARTSEMDRISRDLTRATEDRRRLERERDELSVRVEDLDGHIESLRDEIKDNGREEFRDLERTLRDVRRELSGANADRARLETERDGLADDVGRLRGQLASFEGKIVNESSQWRAESETRLHRAETDAASLRNTVEELTAALVSERTISDDLRQEMSAAGERGNKEISELAEVVRGERRKVQEREREMENELDASRRALRECEASLSVERNAVLQLRRELDAKGQTVHELERLRSALEQSEAATRASEARRQAQVSELEAECKHLKSRSNTIERDRQSRLSSSEQVTERFEKERARSQMLESQLLQNLEVCKKALAGLSAAKQENANLRESLQAMQRSFSQHGKEVERALRLSLEAKIAAIRGEIERQQRVSEAELRDRESALERERTITEQLRSRVSSLEAERAALEAVGQNGRTAGHLLEEAVADVSRARDRAEASVRQREVQLQAERQRVRDLEDQLAHAQAVAQRSLHAYGVSTGAGVSLHSAQAAYLPARPPSVVQASPLQSVLSYESRARLPSPARLPPRAAALASENSPPPSHREYHQAADQESTAVLKSVMKRVSDVEKYFMQMEGDVGAARTGYESDGLVREQRSAQRGEEMRRKRKQKENAILSMIDDEMGDLGREMAEVNEAAERKYAAQLSNRLPPALDSPRGGEVQSTEEEIIEHIATIKKEILRAGGDAYSDVDDGVATVLF